MLTTNPLKLLVLVFLLVTFASCSGGSPVRPDLPKGRCLGNSDCSPGFRCVEGFCEDIYHPRKEIKNY